MNIKRCVDDTISTKTTTQEKETLFSSEMASNTQLTLLYLDETTDIGILDAAIEQIKQRKNQIELEEEKQDVMDMIRQKKYAWSIHKFDIPGAVKTEMGVTVVYDIPEWRIIPLVSNGCEENPEWAERFGLDFVGYDEFVGLELDEDSVQVTVWVYGPKPPPNTPADQLCLMQYTDVEDLTPEDLPVAKRDRHNVFLRPSK